MTRWHLFVLTTVLLVACLPGHIHAREPHLFGSGRPSTAKPSEAAASNRGLAGADDSTPYAVQQADAATGSAIPNALPLHMKACVTSLHRHTSVAAAHSSMPHSWGYEGAAADSSMSDTAQHMAASDRSSTPRSLRQFRAAAHSSTRHILRQAKADIPNSTSGTVHHSAAPAARSRMPQRLTQLGAAAHSSVSRAARHLAAVAHSSVRRILRLVDAGAPEVGRDRFGESVDPSITNQVSARWGNMKRPPARQGLTGEDAEATAGATFPGVHRHAAPQTVFASADAQSNQELPRKKSTVKTRARSAQDRPGPEFPNVASGAPSMPALGVGNLVLAQTFEGATATSLSDSMALPSKTDPDLGQAVSYNMITSKPLREYKAATATASWATTAQPVKSMALTGPANYRFAIAQAGDAVAMSQIERSSKDALPKNLRRQWQDDNDRRLRL